jgi:predicted dehydrogenase
VIKEIKAGIVGLGHLGSIHSRILNEISGENKNIEFTGVYDIDSVKNNKIAEEFKVRAYNSLDELLSEINSLIIVTPTTTHFEIASKAIEKKINLFIEKPVTGSLDEAFKLLSKKDNVKIQIGHVERFNPAFTGLKDFVINPLFIESHRLAQFNPRGTDVSVIQDLMIHDIDIILSLVKSPISVINANGVPILSNDIDIASARLRFENGCTANITASRISLKKMRKMRIFQKSAYISIDFLNNKSEVYRLVDKSEVKLPSMAIPVSENKSIILDRPNDNSSKAFNPIKNELESFFNSILKNEPVKVTLEEGKEALEVADKIINIIQSNNRK